jgi:hypothetical protein
MDLALKEEFFIHLVFASLSKEYDTFGVNYNVQPEKWSLKKLMAMCAQEDRIKVSNGGTINYLKDSKKKTLMLVPPQSHRERLRCKLSLIRKSSQ